MTQPRDARQQACAGVLLISIFIFNFGCSQQVKVSAPPSIDGETRSFTFTAEEEGNVPAGWKVEQTGNGERCRWEIVADEQAPSKTGYVLAQLSESPRSMFNLCVLEQGQYADLKLSVMLKPVEGQIDQGGGLVWRYIDANNYYLGRFNPLENNLRIYEVIAGKRKQLASVDVELPAGRWHELTATMKDDLMVCTMVDVQVAARDKTLKDPGRIGLWTKADARTYFDVLTLTSAE